MDDAVNIYLNFISNINDLDNDLNRLKGEINKALAVKDDGTLSKAVTDIQTMSREILKLASNSETWGKDLYDNFEKVDALNKEILSVITALRNDPTASTNKSINSTVEKLKEFSTILSRISRVDASKKFAGDITKSTSSMQNHFKEMKANAILAGRSIEEYKQELIDAGIQVPKAFNYKDVVEYNEKLETLTGNWEKYLNTGRQERWSDDVVAKRTELLNESLAITQQVVNLDSDIQASQETINELDAVNRDLNNRKLAIKYQLLEVQKQIAAAESSRLTTGEPQDKTNWKMLKEQETVLKQQDKMYDRQIKQNNILRATMAETLKASQTETNEVNNQVDAEKRRNEEIQKSIRAEQENMKQAKLTTSQYYYRLRSMKLVNHYLQAANNAMNNFGKKALSVFGKAGKSISNFTKKFKLFHINIQKANKDLNSHVNIVKRANSAHSDWGKTLKGGITTLLKYTLGIRSLYVLFNRLRGAMSDGMQVMATQYSSVNTTMSSIVTSLNQMKNALTTAIQPLTVLIAPMLEHFANTLSEVTAKIASFFAAFTGQKFVYKAIRVNKDYIESLKKEKKAVKELNQEQLANYDMLNIIDQKKEDEAEDEDLTDAIGFEKVPIEANKALVDFINKLKDLIKRLLAPIINAWNKWKDEIIKSLKQLWASVKKLFSDILRDFMTVWEEAKTQEIFEMLFEILRDLIDVLRIIIDKIDEAWNYANNGLRILRAIRDIIWRIVKNILRMVRYLKQWAQELTLIPLFTAIADALEEIEQNMQNILDLTFTLWQGLLEIVKYLLEKALPTLVDMFSDLVVIANNLAGGINKALSNGDDIFDQNDRLYRILKKIEGIIDIILADIKDCLEATKEWAAELNWEPLFSTLEDGLKLVSEGVRGIVDLAEYLYIDIVLPMAKYIVEILLPAVVTILSILIQDIGILATNIRETLESGNLGQEILFHVLEIVNKVLVTMIQLASETGEWVASLNFEPLFSSLNRLLQDIQPALEFILQLISSIYTIVVQKFISYMIEEGLPKLMDTIGEIVKKVDWDHLIKKVNEFLSAFEEFLEKAWETFVILLGDLGDAFAKFVNSDTFDHIIDTFVKWVDKADPDKMAKGIQDLVKAFIALKAALSFLTYVGQLKEFVMTMINWHNNRSMVKTVKDSTTAINELKSAMKGTGTKAAEAAAGMDAASASASGLSSTLSTIGGGASIFGGVLLYVTGMLDGLENGFSLSEIAATAFGDALVALGLVLLGAATGGVAVLIAALMFLEQQIFIGITHRMKEYGEDFNTAWDEFWGGIREKTSEIFNKLGEFIGGLIGNLVGYIVNSFRDWIASYNGDYLQMGKDILFGILRIFFLPVELLKIVGSAALAFITGIVTGFRDAFDMHSPSRNPDIVNLGVDILLGVLNGMLDVIAGFADWALNNILIPIKGGIVNGVQSILGDLFEAGSTLFNSVKEGVMSKAKELVSELVQTWQEIKSNAEDWWNDISNAIFDRWLDIVSTAQNKFEELRSFIESKWSEAKQNAEDWWNDIRNHLLDCWENIKNEAHNKFEEVRQNIENKWSEMKSNAENWWGDILNILQNTWQSIIDEAKNKFEEIRSSIEHVWDDIKSNVERKWDEIHDAISGKIDGLFDLVGRMSDFGRDVIDGFVDGIQDAWDGAGDFVHEVWENVSGDVCDFFGIHSPSRLFRYYGEMLTEGLVKGVSDDSDDVTDSIESLVPGLDAFDDMYDRIIAKLTYLRKDAVTIIHSMIDDINTEFESMSNLDVLNNISSQLASLNEIKIPDIALGKVISPQIELSINTDTSKLEDLLEQVLDKLDDIPNTGDSNNSPIVLQLDKSEIARAVWDEQEKRYKQLGRRPVFS